MIRDWPSCRQPGATEVVPETFEASLTLVSQALTLLQLPAPQVANVVDTLRRQRYATLRTHPAEVRAELQAEPAELLRSVVLPPRWLGRGAAAGRGSGTGRGGGLHGDPPAGHHGPRTGRGDRAARGRRGGDLRHAGGACNTPRRCCWPASGP